MLVGCILASCSRCSARDTCVMLNCSCAISFSSATSPAPILDQTKYNTGPTPVQHRHRDHRERRTPEKHQTQISKSSRTSFGRSAGFRADMGGMCVRACARVHVCTCVRVHVCTCEP